MKIREIDIGVYKIKLTFYRTGNVHICFTNRLTKEEKSMVVKNPLILHRKVDSVSYAT